MQESTTTPAAATIGGVLADLTEVGRHLAAGLPMDELAIEHEARICDRLAEEIAEAAAMLRGKQPPAEDQRVVMAREFLDAIAEYKVASRPLSVLQREDAELRRLVGQLLDVIDGRPR
jgi:hypothetical protein